MTFMLCGIYIGHIVSQMTQTIIASLPSYSILPLMLAAYPPSPRTWRMEAAARVPSSAQGLLRTGRFGAI